MNNDLEPNIKPLVVKGQNMEGNSNSRQDLNE